MIEASYSDATRVPVRGGQVTVVRRGSGRPTLLLHGIPLSTLTWRHTIGPLSDRREVISVDLLGYGRSDKPARADYSPAGQAAVLVELIDKLALPQVDLVGSSYGCAVALTLAATAPERVGKLVLINPVCYPGGPHDLERLSRIRLVAAVAKPVLRTAALGRRMMASRLRASYADPSAATPELVDAHYRLLLERSGEVSYLSSLRALKQEDLVALLPRVTQRTLVIWGAGDHVLPAGDGERLVADLPNARLEVIEGVGHFPHEEAPERVNPLAAAFLTDTAPARTEPAASTSKGPR